MRRALLLIPLLTACASREVATFGAGCFWCSEAAFQQIEGVVDVRSGFMGEGEPAEVVQVRFDPHAVSYDELLGWFWSIHDPTSVDKQGEDEGPEYRSVVFVHDDEQRARAEASRVAAQTGLMRPIVTSIEAAGEFVLAEEGHQDYYTKNRDNEHCRTVIAPHLRRVGLDDG